MSEDTELERFEEAPINPTGDEANASPRGENTIDAVMRVPMAVQVVLGTTKMPVSQLLKLSRGTVIELDRRVGEPVDLMINDRLVARGDLVDVGGGLVGVNLREIVKEHLSEEG